MKKIMIFGLFVLASLGIQAQAYKIGDTVKDFKLKNVDGKMVSLADYEDAKGFIVIFTCNHCPYSVAYQDRIIEIDQKYKAKGYPVIAINPNDAELYPSDSYENMIVRAKEKTFPFPYLYDAKQEVYRKFGATKTPHVFILSNKAGKYTLEYKGAIDDNYKDAAQAKVHYVNDVVDTLLQGKKPKMTETKAIGCGIKTKG
jgi:peroxiredoxin